ncbi:hypothetical protein Tco_1570219 [Tanacetum coccineum]
MSTSKAVLGVVLILKVKMLLMNAHENGVVLDEEQLLFLAGGTGHHIFDIDVDDLALKCGHMSLKLDQCDAFGLDPGHKYDSNTPFELQDHDNFVDHMDVYNGIVGRTTKVRVVKWNVYSVEMMHFDVNLEKCLNRVSKVWSSAARFKKLCISEEIFNQMMSKWGPEYCGKAILRILKAQLEGILKVCRFRSSVKTKVLATGMESVETVRGDCVDGLSSINHRICTYLCLVNYSKAFSGIVNYVIGNCLKRIVRRDSKDPSITYNREKKVTFTDTCCVEDGPTIEGHLNYSRCPFFPQVNPVEGEPSSTQSTSRDVSLAEPHQVNQPPDHLRKWSKDHPLDNIVCNPSRSVSTRKRLASDALW